MRSAGCFHFHRRSTPRLRATVLLLFLLAATCFARCVVGARSRSSYKQYGRPAPAVRLYGGGGYLPRPKVIPPSGPSEGHNSIGPETTLDRLRRKP
ncbi:unnamed protein product [Urochloa decumbens]|uniref:Secreted protein n=1 Tax=Urochloa decumbens TaxID=240449 RepID=A0ABC9F7E0_9POAL